MILPLVKAFWKPVLLIAIVIFSLFKVYEAGEDSKDTEWQAKWNEEHSRLSQELAAAESAARERETYWVNELDRVSRDAQITIDQINNDSSAAVVAANSLRQSAENAAMRASKACTKTTVTSKRASTETGFMVFADVLASCGERLKQLGETADRSRAAGLTCERSCDALRF